MSFASLKSCLVLGFLFVATAQAQAANPEWDQATRLYTMGDYKGALSAFQKIAEKTPRDPSVHYMLGQCYKGMNNTKQAISELDWVSKYATDPRIKGGATALLAQLKPGGGGGHIATIPGAVSPYNLLPKGGSNGSGAPGAAGAAAAPVSYPPSKTIINGSIGETVAAAYKLGWVPCHGRCINFGTPGWEHRKFEGYPDSNFYQGSTKEDGTVQYFSQLHSGSILKDGKEVGPCPECNGSGWVKK